MPGEATSGIAVLHNQRELDLSSLLEVQIRNTVALPDTAVVRLRDPTAEEVDTVFTIGHSLAIELAAVDAVSHLPIFDGEVVALEPEFTEGRCVIAARAYDLGWRLNRTRTSRTFQNQKAEDMVRTIIQAHQLTAGTIAPTTVTHKFFQQSMETDWEFCKRLARLNDFEFWVDREKKAHFGPRTKGRPAVTLTWGEAGNLLTFKPRMSGMAQVSQVTVSGNDPGTAQQVSANASRPDVPAASQAASSRSRVTSALGGGNVVVADRVVATQAEAREAAQATLDRLASSFIEAEGKAKGDPKLLAGTTVKIAGVGQFSGDYVLSQTVHTYRSGGGGYTTSFVIAGRTPHTFSGLIGRNDQADWASSLVIGIVTNNNDPDKLGRVRVKFPALGSTIEGWWARVSTIGAGNQRGVFMLPQPGDEVVVMFEHGDTRRPIVIGTLFNGSDKPPADLTDAQQRKPRFGVKTTHDVHIAGTQQMTLRTGEKLTIEVNRDGANGTGNYLLDAKGNIEQKAAGALKATANQAIELNGQSVTIKGTGSVTVEAQGSLKLKGAVVDIEATGMVNVKGTVINLG